MDVGQQDGAGAEVIELVHEALGAGTRDHDPDRDPALPAQGRDGRALEPGRLRGGGVEVAGLDVVVHHHVAAGHQDAVDAALEDIEALVLGRPGPGDQHGLGLQDHLAEDGQARRLEGAAGLDDIGDDIGHAELDAGLDRAVEPGHGGLDAALLQEGLDHPGVGRGDPLAGQLRQVVVLPGGPGEVEARSAEAQAQHLFGLGARVAEQVATGDADVEGALADVERDVARAQVEELAAVLGVGERELLGVGALAVAGLLEDLGGRDRQGALVGDGDSEQGHGVPQRWA